MVAAAAANFSGHEGSHRASSESYDLAIAGGGPAGLATAIVAAEQGLSVVVLERREYPNDKACGEGILPPGVSALERLGVNQFLDPSRFHPFAGIRFVQEDNSSVESILPHCGLGIRRTVLIEALTMRAEQLGVAIKHRCGVTAMEVTPGESVLRTTAGRIGAGLVVAADGLHSPLRRAAGLEASTRLPRRFALRQHFRVVPWTDLVEVYVDRKGEAVVTPVSADTVSVNFTWQDGLIARPTIPSLAGRFPLLQKRLSRGSPLTPPMGAGPMSQAVRRRTSDRLVLMGDAAGFVDSISGDGLSIAFNSALILGRHLSRVLAQDATKRSLAAYEKAAGRLFRGYWLVTNALLWLARHPRARTTTIHFLSRRERMLGTIMNAAMAMMTTAD